MSGGGISCARSAPRGARAAAALRSVRPEPPRARCTQQWLLARVALQSLVPRVSGSAGAECGVVSCPEAVPVLGVCGGRALRAPRPPPGALTADAISVRNGDDRGDTLARNAHRPSFGHLNTLPTLSIKSNGFIPTHHLLKSAKHSTIHNF